MGTARYCQMFPDSVMPVLTLPPQHRSVICILGCYCIHGLLQMLQSHLAKGERRNRYDVYYEKPLAFWIWIPDSLFPKPRAKNQCWAWIYLCGSHRSIHRLVRFLSDSHKDSAVLFCLFTYISVPESSSYLKDWLHSCGPQALTPICRFIFNSLLHNYCGPFWTLCC